MGEGEGVGRTFENPLLWGGGEGGDYPILLQKRPGKWGRRKRKIGKNFRGGEFLVGVERI